MKGVLAILALALVAPAFASSRDLLQMAPAPSSGITDADILNFALNLEYLEASFYSYAAFGVGLNSSLLGTNPGTVTGGQKAALTAETLGYVEQIAMNEIAHVAFLRAALGDAAISIPDIDIGTAFATAADAAFNMTLSPAFDPYANDLFFLHGAFIFEDLGVTAYKGAAPLIADSTILAAAAGILAVEAYHAGSIRSFLCPQADATTPYGVTPAVITQDIANLINTLGMVDADSGVTTTLNGATVCNLVPADSNGLAFSRTPMEVINIATAGTGKGLFFPMGLNGVIA